jgi:hypothetical protein
MPKPEEEDKRQRTRSRAHDPKGCEPRSLWVETFLELGFWSALLLLFVLTLLPISSDVSFLNDKAEHFLAFLALMFLAVGIWGRRRMLALAIALAAVGGGIEILQALPMIGRDAELLDWVSDLGGIAMGASLAILSGVYRRRGEMR